MTMVNQTSSNLSGGNDIEGIETEQATNPDESFSGESCSQGCRLHWPMRLASITIIVVLLGLYGLLQFSTDFYSFQQR